MTIKIGDIIRSKYSQHEEFEIIFKSYYPTRYKIKCNKTRKSGNLMKEFDVDSDEMCRDFELVKSAQKPFDKAFDEVTKKHKNNKEGESIHIDEWNKLYCSCDNRKSKTVRILHTNHQVCTTCKKEII